MLTALRASRDVLPSPRSVVVGAAASAGITRWSAVMEEPVASALPSRSDGALSTAATGMGRLLALDERDRLMVVLPLFGANSQFSVAMAIATGASILLERAFSPSTFWMLARKRGATQVSLPGLYLSHLYARPARKSDPDHSIRQVLSVGTPREIHEAFEHRFGVSVVEAYGSDGAGFVTVNPVERGRRKLGTSGLPVPWCEVAVLDDEMRPLDAGIAGHICVRPRHGEREGWLRSGALGTSDEEGFFTVLTPKSGSCAAALRRVS